MIDIQIKSLIVISIIQIAIIVICALNITHYLYERVIRLLEEYKQIMQTGNEVIAEIEKNLKLLKKGLKDANME